MTAMTGSLAALAVAAFAFVASHLALPVPAVRQRLTAALGEYGYLALYSALSIALFVWMVAAYAAAPEMPLWTAPTGLRHLALSVMLPAVLLFVCGYTQRNPTAVVLDRFAGEQPYGITRVSRHPVMWGVGLWAIAHIIANDDAASLILFLAI
ncbi:MAG: NnrU protein, partial [Rhodospirillales bacterium]|nr:NnrU protein [Rhodospirillales bacterium]